jgi:hypothetical protein
MRQKFSKKALLHIKQLLERRQKATKSAQAWRLFFYTGEG